MITEWREMVSDARRTMRRSLHSQRRQASPRRLCAGNAGSTQRAGGRNDRADDVSFAGATNRRTTARCTRVHRRTGCVAVRCRQAHGASVSRTRRPYVFSNPRVGAAGSCARLRQRSASFSGGSVGVARLRDSELVLSLVPQELRCLPRDGPQASHIGQCLRRRFALFRASRLRTPGARRPSLGPLRRHQVQGHREDRVDHQRKYADEPRRPPAVRHQRRRERC